MKDFYFRLGLAAVLLFSTGGLRGEIKAVVEHNKGDVATPGFRFSKIPPPRRGDAAGRAEFKIVDGQRDPAGGGLERLHDGRLPAEEDEPSANFFFSPGTDGGRVLIDLGEAKDLKQVNTYSWHGGSRGPQVYSVYAARGDAKEFNPAPSREIEPGTCGWKLLAIVDTRPSSGEPGGQYGVSIQDTAGSLGTNRYVLLDIRKTESEDPFGNTFYSEIDVVDNLSAEEPSGADAVAKGAEETIEIGGCTIVLDTLDTPDLQAWAHDKVGPMAKEWYPRLIKMMPSEGFEAPKNVRITFNAQMRGVADTSNARIRCAAGWFRQNLEGEALGAVFHELVHVVQRYGRVRPTAENAVRPPGWLVEGIADYLRWYKFEATSRGADITARNIGRARYDGNYRITANFLNWAAETYDKDLVQQLNAAIREGRYREDLWKDRTQHTLPDLGAEWKAALEKKLGVQPAQTKPVS